MIYRKQVTLKTGEYIEEEYEGTVHDIILLIKNIDEQEEKQDDR